MLYDDIAYIFMTVRDRVFVPTVRFDSDVLGNLSVKMVKYIYKWRISVGVRCHRQERIKKLDHSNRVRLLYGRKPH